MIRAPGDVKGTFCKLLVIHCRLLFNGSEATLRCFDGAETETSARRRIHSATPRGNEFNKYLTSAIYFDELIKALLQTRGSKKIYKFNLLLEVQ